MNKAKETLIKSPHPLCGRFACVDCVKNTRNTQSIPAFLSLPRAQIASHIGQASFNQYFLKYRILICLLTVLLAVPVFAGTVFADGIDPDPLPAAVPGPGEPLSEGSDIVTRGTLYDKDTNKQFITVQDRDGNIFYLVIDYDAPVDGDEEQYQTYFLNPVDTGDLTAMAKDGEEKPVVCSCADRCQAGAVNMNCELCAKNMTECAGREAPPKVPEETPAPVPAEPEPEPAGLNPAAILLVLVLMCGIGAFAFFRYIRQKPKTRGSTDLDDYDYGEDEAEDDAPWETEGEASDEADAGADNAGESEEVSE